MEVASMMPAYNTALQYAQYHDMRSHPVNPAMAASMMNAGRHHEYPQYHQMHSPAVPSSHHRLSTPTDELNKPSLPSISNLLGIADGDKASQPSESRSPSQARIQPAIPVDQTTITSHPNAADASGMTIHTHRPALPPTPPMRSDSMPDAIQSPSTISSHSSFSGTSHPLAVNMNNIDALQQRPYHAPISMPKHLPGSLPVIYTGSPYVMQPYMTSPVSNGSYYSPEAMYHSGMYHQRPLPSNFPGTVAAVPMMHPGMVGNGNPWEHHHYISPVTQAGFPSVQDRYMCATCKKAFSRPSSLKIHSHSHTGEKPFKCPHSGCNKSFSVRSNMKRHERGCHTPEMANYTST